MAMAMAMVMVMRFSSSLFVFFFPILFTRVRSVCLVCVFQCAFSFRSLFLAEREKYHPSEVCREGRSDK